ncbi:hypothetical protein GCM10011389_16470 [Pontibacillus salipaludis]|uniref:Uncharacterized protein n=1 Tax=Pontibacillus salipaludis TaxID=1697394 RepID=A0ABQ1Q238_9BACI|nr:hypothetical protein GCM10011389_16470 [Pontibacillus salipaludis]
MVLLVLDVASFGPLSFGKFSLVYHKGGGLETVKVKIISYMSFFRIGLLVYKSFPNLLTVAPVFT